MSIKMNELDKKGSDFQEGSVTFDAYSGTFKKTLKKTFLLITYFFLNRSRDGILRRGYH